MQRTQRRATKAISTAKIQKAPTKKKTTLKSSHRRRIATTTKSKHIPTITKTKLQQSHQIPTLDHTLYHLGQNSHAKTTSTPRLHLHQKRSMAFTFDKKTSYMNLLNPTREALPWEKHTISAESEVAKSLKNGREAPPLDFQEQHQPPQSQTTRPSVSNMASSKFSFSSINQSRHQQPNDQSQEQHEQQQIQQFESFRAPNTFTPESRFGGRITSVMQPALDAQKNNDVSNVPLNDLESMFKHSTLAGAFSQQPTGPTLWSMFTAENPTLYLMGTRTVISGTGERSEPVFAFRKMTVNKQMRTIKDDFTTYSYNRRSPLNNVLVTSLEPDLSRGTAKSIEDHLNITQSVKTVVRFRGVGWKWHGQVQMSQVSSTTDDEDTYYATRTKYTSDGLLAEKIMRSVTKVKATMIDDLKLVDKAFFEKRLKEALDGTYN